MEGLCTASDGDECYCFGIFSDLQRVCSLATPSIPTIRNAQKTFAMNNSSEFDASTWKQYLYTTQSGRLWPWTSIWPIAQDLLLLTISPSCFHGMFIVTGLENKLMVV